MRNFIQPVAMPVNQKQYAEILPSLTPLGYTEYIDGDTWIEDFYLLSNKWSSHENGKLFLANKGYKKHRNLGGAIVIDYNPDLFLALAAMSEGGEMFPGEWVISNQEDIATVIDVSDFSKHLSVEFLDGSKGNYPENIFRKATAEEIVVHFSKKESDLNFPSGGVKSSISPDEPEPIVSEHDTKKNAEHFAEMTKRSTSIDEWRPKPFEPIWVWNNGTDKLRHKMLFAFASEHTIFAFDPQFEKWSNFEVHEFQNYARIDDPILVPIETVRAHFAKTYGVPPALIQIEQ